MLQQSLCGLRGKWTRGGLKYETEPYWCTLTQFWSKRFRQGSRPRENFSDCLLEQIPPSKVERALKDRVPTPHFWTKNHSRTHSPLQHKTFSMYSCKHLLFVALSINIKNWIGQSFSNNKRFGSGYMSFSTHPGRWLIETILLLALILIAIF